MVPERLPGTGEEMPAGGSHDQQGKSAEPKPEALIGFGHHHGAEPHAPDHQANAQGQTHRHLDQKGTIEGAVLLLPALVGLIFILNDPGAIAGALDSPDQCLWVGMAGRGGGIIGQIHVRPGYPGYRIQRLFDGAHTGSAGGPAYRQGNLIAVIRRRARAGAGVLGLVSVGRRR